MKVRDITMNKHFKSWSILGLSVIIITVGLLIVSNALAWTKEIRDAAIAVANGTASREQEAIAFRHNREINEMALMDPEMKKIYPEVQGRFEELNNRFVQQAAEENGLRANLQQKKPGETSKPPKPGTDTDVLVSRGDPTGKPITAEQIDKTRQSYNRRVNEYLSDSNVPAKEPTNWTRRTDTDFMPVPSETTPEEFRRIAEETNRARGTMYTNPQAAEVEAMIRRGDKINVPQAGTYVSQMEELARHKFRHADELAAQAQQARSMGDIARADSLEAQAQLARSQGSKYIDRIDTAGDKVVKDMIGEQAGVTRPESRHVTDAVRDLVKERGPETSRQALTVGTMPDHALQMSQQNFAENLARLSISRPDLASQIEETIARQARNLPPSQKGQLIENMRRIGGDDLAGRIAGRMREQAMRQPGKVTEMLGRHGRTINIALNAAQILDCLSKGKTISQCAIEFAEGVAIGEAVIIVFGPTGAIILGGTIGAWEIYKAGVEATQQWADAQQRSAIYDQRERQTRINLEKLDKEVDLLKEKLHRELQTSMVSASDACRAVLGEVESTEKTSGEITSNINIFKDLVSAIRTASTPCAGAPDKIGKTVDLHSKVKEYEDKVIKGIEWAIGKAQTCNSKEDAAKIKEMFNNCLGLTAGLLAYAARAKAGYESLVAIMDKVNIAKESLGIADALAGEISSKAASVSSMKESAKEKIEVAKNLKSAHVGKIDQAFLEIESLRGAFPDNLLPANEEKFNQIRGIVSSYKGLSCEPEPAVWLGRLLKSDAEAWKASQSAPNLLASAQSALSVCDQIDMGAAEWAMDTVVASANSAQFFLGVGEKLPQQADACLARLRDKDAGDRISELRNAEDYPGKPGSQGSGTNINVADSYGRDRTIRSGQESQQAQGTAGATQAERNTASQAQDERDKGNINAQGQATGSAIAQSQREHATAQQTAQQDRQTSLGTTVEGAVAGGLTSGVATGLDSGFGTLGRGAGQQSSHDIGATNTPSQGSTSSSGSQTSQGGTGTQASTQAIACNTTAKSGTNAPETVAVNVGKGSGTVQFFYNMYNIKDQMIVSYGGQTLFDTGCVSGSKTVPLNISGTSEQVIITVKPACAGSSTNWDLRLECPKPSSP